MVNTYLCTLKEQNELAALCLSYTSEGTENLPNSHGPLHGLISYYFVFVSPQATSATCPEDEDEYPTRLESCGYDSDTAGSLECGYVQQTSIKHYDIQIPNLDLSIYHQSQK